MWAVYDLRDDVPAVRAEGRRAVVSAHDGSLVGFYCLGEDARVPGLAGDEAVVDLGLGMAPEFVGQGPGQEFALTVLDDVRRYVPAAALRTVIQAWNARSLALARGLGFTDAGGHVCRQDGGDVAYTVLIRRVDQCWEP